MFLNMLDDYINLGKIKELKKDEYNWKQVPKSGGIYIVVYTQLNMPVFLKKGNGGSFRGKEPNISIEKLKERWVNFKSDGDKVLYIGKSNNLRRRIKLYIRFGKKEPVAKWGGRYIWQITDIDDSKIYFKEDGSPRETEKRLIQEFKEKYGGRRPFANLID
jgi:hypothetical protein